MNLFFVIDEYSDIAPVEEVRQQKDIVMDALRNPHKPRPEGEWVGGEVARQYVSLSVLLRCGPVILSFSFLVSSFVLHDSDHAHHSFYF